MSKTNDMRNALVIPGYGVTIDTDDYLVLRELLLRSDTAIFNDDDWRVLGITKVQAHGKRVCQLDLRGYRYIPGPVYTLDSLPSSIGTLSHLKSLNFSNNTKLSRLPDSIGNLANLQDLNLSKTAIACLPSSVGQLKNLKKLLLDGTSKLVTLPEELGNLTSLNRLDLSDSRIKSLPSSIGQLRALKRLRLALVRSLGGIPNELCNLISLTVLNLAESSITNVPAFIGNLKNLKILYLPGLKKLEKLPESIGDLAQLELLALYSSGVTMLPSSIGNLKNLKHLDLWHSEITCLPDSFLKLRNLMHLDIRVKPMAKLVKHEEGFKFLVSLLRSCWHLGCLGFDTRYFKYDQKKRLGFALACNRARYKMKPWIVDKWITTATKDALWPHILKMARLIFDEYQDPAFYVEKDIEFCGEKPQCTTKKPDAIFQVLLLAREAFLQLVMENKAKAPQQSHYLP